MFATRLIFTLLCLVALVVLVQADTHAAPSGFVHRRKARRCGRQRKGNQRNRLSSQGSAGAGIDSGSDVVASPASPSTPSDGSATWASADVAQASSASNSDAAQTAPGNSDGAQSGSASASASAPAASGSGSSSSSGGSGGAGDGKAYEGEGTYYDVAGMPSCGPNFGQYGNGDKVAAASAALMAQFGGGNPNNNPLCGRKLRATHEGKSTEVTIIDTCPPCTVGSVDFSPAAFNDLADQSLGRIKINWSFI